MLLMLIDHIGVFVFAISGFLIAANKKMDLFGCAVIAFITSLGGGTLRDLLLNQDVAWMKSETLILTVLLAIPTAFLLRNQLSSWSKTMLIFDSIGIGVCTILGMQKALDLNHLYLVAIFLGVISATFGGVIRDVLCNEIPLIFRKEIYATACFCGASVFGLGVYFGIMDKSILLIISSAIIVLVRVLAVIFHWQIPLVKMKD